MRNKRSNSDLSQVETHYYLNVIVKTNAQMNKPNAIAAFSESMRKEEKKE